MINQIIFIPKLNATSDEMLNIKHIIASISSFVDSMTTNEIVYKQWSGGLNTDNSLFVSLGGDGTALFAIRCAAESDNSSVLAINLGRLGFLADYIFKHGQHFLNDIVDIIANNGGSVKSEYRSLIRTELNGKTFLAVNEFAIMHDKIGTMVECDLFVDDIFVGHQNGDGILVSTPTGSTAYSLSTGGSIMHPSVNALQINMVAPHRIVSRPFVIPLTSYIDIKLSNPSANIIVLADGQQVGDLNTNKLDIKITSYPTKVKLWHNPEWDYYSNLASKMGWWKE